MTTKNSPSEIQIGKNGLTANFFQTLENHLKKRDTVKVSLLPSARENKAQAKAIVTDIEKKLPKNYTVHLIGYRMTIKKWRREVRSKVGK